MQHTDSPAILQADGRYTFRPALDEQTIHAIEDSHRTWEPIRRAALAVLSRSYDDLAEPLVKDDADGAETLLYLLEQLEEYKAWRERETDLIGNALARLQMVLFQEAERFTTGETTEEGEK